MLRRLLKLRTIRPPSACRPPLHPDSLSEVYFSDLNDDQVEALFVRVDWHRLWLERLHARVVAKGFPPAIATRVREASMERPVPHTVSGLRRRLIISYTSRHPYVRLASGGRPSP